MIRNKRKGFTIVELVVILAIIIVVAALLIPTLINFFERGRAQRDASGTDEIVRAVELAVVEDDIYDEVYHYMIRNNFVTYTDSDGDYGIALKDEEYWAPDGSGKAVTITFNPVHEGSETYYILANGLVNDMTYQNGSVVSPPRIMTGCQAYASQCRLSEMTYNDVTISALLYNRIKTVTGEKITIDSATYRNSSFTVFILFTYRDGVNVATVYGSFNGTNLDDSSLAATGSGSEEYDDEGRPINPKPGGTTNASFDNTDLTGGGYVTYRNYPTYEGARLDKNKFFAFLNTVDKQSIKTLAIATTGSKTGTDVSDVGDGSILAWVNGDGVFIGCREAGKKIKMPTDCTNLFNTNSTGLTNVSVINVNKGDVSETTLFANMFSDNKKATSIDVGGWNTENGIVFAGMFNNCKLVSSLKLDTFKFGNARTLNAFLKNCNHLTAIECQNWRMPLVEDLAYAFYGCANVTSLPINNLGAHSLAICNSMFCGMSSLKSLDLSSWDVSKLSSFNSLFKDCTSLETLDLSGWQTTAATSMASMFENCRQLEELDVSSFNTDKVTNFKQMFYKCQNLSYLTLSNFNTTKATNMTNMFEGMLRLEEITLGSQFTFRGNGTTRCYLPEPSSTYIYGATGTWMDDMGGSFKPDEIPNKVAATYYATDTSSLAVFAPQNSWWRGHTDKKIIQRIIITNTYKSETWDEMFNADVDNEGAIEVYVEGNVAYIVNRRNRRSKAAFQLSPDASSTFADFVNLKNITGLKLLNTLNVTNMDNFFGKVSGDTVIGCTQLTYAPGYEDWNMQSLRTARYAFAGVALPSINLSNWQIFNVSNLTGMFYKCKSTIINLSGWNVQSVSNYNNMFKGSTSLGSVSLSGWKPSQTAQYDDMFEDCTNLSTIIASSSFSLNAQNISMFNNCTSILGQLGTTYQNDMSEYAHVDVPGNPGYFSYESSTGTFSAKLYTSGSASGTYTELTYAGSTADAWDYQVGSRLLEIKLYELPDDQEKTVTVTVPAGMYIETNSWTQPNDDVASVEFTALDIDPSKNGLQQGTGNYANSKTGTLTFTLQPYVTTTTISCRVMFDLTVWDKNKGALSPRTDYQQCTITDQTSDIVKGDPIIVVLDETVSRKLSHVAASKGVGSPSNGFGYSYSIWQQSSYQYITEPSQPATGYAFNGNYLDSYDRSTQMYYYDKVVYSCWLTSTDSSGKEIRAKIAARNQMNSYNTTPTEDWWFYNTDGSRTRSSAGSANFYQVTWIAPHTTSNGFSFPNLNWKLEASDGFQAGKTAYAHYKIELTSHNGQTITLYRRLSCTIQSTAADYSKFTGSGSSICVPTESFYEGSNGACACLGYFAFQNACISQLSNIAFEFEFDNTTTSGPPKLKVEAFRAPTEAYKSTAFNVTLINDVGQQFGPYPMILSSSNSNSYGTYITAEKVASQNGLSGTYYIKKVNYTLSTVAGSVMKNYLYPSGSPTHSSAGGSFWGRASAQATSKVSYTCGGSTRTATATTKVVTPNGNNAYFSGMINAAQTPYGNNILAGEDFEIDLQIAASNYQGIYNGNYASSNAFCQPVVYAILPAGVNIEGVIINDSPISATTKQQEHVVRVKSLEIDGVLSYVYKITWDGKNWFGYSIAGTSGITNMPNTYQWVRLMCSTDTSLATTSINVRNSFIFTDINSTIYNYSSYNGQNMIYDTYDIDNDGNTSERFSALNGTLLITINER